jgi:hypothetical protein
MPFEKFDLDTLTTERRKAIAQSIRTATPEELKKIGDEIFPYADDPWRDAFLQFLKDNPGCTFHYAVTNDNVHLVYCRDKDKGIWFMPGAGKGILQERGLKAMKDAIEGLH